MDKKIKTFVEIFFSIIFSGVILYLLELISNPTTISDNLRWVAATLIVIGISFWMISYIFDIEIKQDKEFIVRIVFIFSMILTFFSVTRLIHFFNLEGYQNYIQNQYHIFLFFLIVDGLTLFLSAILGDNKKRKKEFAIISFFIFGLVLFLFIFKDSLLYGGII